MPNDPQGRRHVAVIVPVRDQAALLGACLEAICAEAEPFGAEVIVVDDGSSDAPELVVHGSSARLIRLERSGGPYRARNVGWRATDADVLAFADARTRPRAGWLRALVEAVEDPSVGVAGGDALCGAGSSLVERLFAWWQPMSAEFSTSHPFLPFVSGGNLAARRDVLERLDGFWEVLSGGDADVCWRAQLVLGLRIVRVPEAIVDLVPRSSLRDAWRQYQRYGSYGRRLEHRFGIAPEDEARSSRQPGVRAHILRLRRVGEVGVEGVVLRVLVRIVRLAYVLGRRRGERSLRRDPPDRFEWRADRQRDAAAPSASLQATASPPNRSSYRKIPRMTPEPSTET
jgi:glycosyltransferase involved in cell wall biosynthesis